MNPRPARYVRVRDAGTGSVYILAEACLGLLYKGKKGKTLPAGPETYEILGEIKGADLVGRTCASPGNAGSASA